MQQEYLAAGSRRYTAAPTDTERTVQGMVSNSPQDEVAQRLPAHQLPRRVAPLPLQHHRTLARRLDDLQQRAAALLRKLLVVVAVVHAFLQRAIPVVVCVSTTPVLGI